MAKVYAWPPVHVFGPDWSEDAPIDVSRSFLTGRRYASASRPKRRVVSFSASARSCGGYGAGYMEALKRLLDGGLHLVRLHSRRINYRPAYDDDARQGAPLTWRQDSGPAPLDWSGLTWVSGVALTAARQSPAHTLRVDGLPPSVVIAWPGEFLTVYRASDSAESTVMVERVARTNASGVALIRTVTEARWDGRVSIGTSDTAVFEALSIPRAARPVSGDWTYDWSFSEVFADEVGGFEEINPWG